MRLRRIDLQPDVAARLAYDAIANALQRLDKFTGIQIPRQLYAARISSRT